MFSMSVEKELGQALLEERPENYDEFIDQNGRKELVNIAGVHVATYSLGDQTIETLAEILDERDVYASDGIDIENKIRDAAVKSKVYDRIKDEVGSESDAAGKVHYNRTDGNLADMQLKEEFGLDPRKTSGRFFNWRELTDLELSREGYIMGHGKIAHNILRYADSRDDLSRREASEAIDEYIERGDVKVGREMHLYNIIMSELEQKNEKLNYEDLMDWMVEDYSSEKQIS